MSGSWFLLSADSKDDVEAFNAADPFNKDGLWKMVNIHPFNKRVDDL